MRKFGIRHRIAFFLNKSRIYYKIDGYGEKQNSIATYFLPLRKHFFMLNFYYGCLEVKLILAQANTWSFAIFLASYENMLLKNLKTKIYS